MWGFPTHLWRVVSRMAPPRPPARGWTKRSGSPVRSLAPSATWFDALGFASSVSSAGTPESFTTALVPSLARTKALALPIPSRFQLPQQSRCRHPGSVYGCPSSRGHPSSYSSFLTWSWAMAVSNPPWSQGHIECCSQSCRPGISHDSGTHLVHDVCKAQLGIEVNHDQ